MSKPAPPPPLDGYIIYDPVDPFENEAGPFYWRLLDDGSHHFVLRTEARHANAYDVIHGGLLMTMADLTMAVTAKAESDDAYVTVAFNSEFVAAGYAGDLVESRAELVRRTGSMAFVRGRIHVGETTLFVCSAVMKRVGKRGALNKS
ncbi:MAG: PaaI family thioesterase [Alphaproteobacteria bacterium]|jgi:uncharacterized protein (TIGR00369 family)|nr:PaaI family thioesterase [Alphaproteobacteria bacterium]MDP6832228.1 PaaI family thioesterase [Alphaproteobacteria bacterium]